jgi:hypothetical protein
MQGTKIKIAHAKDKVNIILKGAAISDVHPGMKIDFF